MTPRAILRDQNVLFGRWRFDGTSIAVAEVRAAFCADPKGAVATFQRQGLTREDIEAAMSFAFPDVRSLAVSRIPAQSGALRLRGRHLPQRFSNLQVRA